MLPIWPLTPSLLGILATGLLARQAVAQLQGQEVIQIPLPSSSIGHISSTFFTKSPGRLNRAKDFDLVTASETHGGRMAGPEAAAAPLSMLAASGAMVALGVAQASSKEH